MIGFNLQKTKRLFTDTLAEKFPQREAEQLIRILLEDLFGIDWNQQLMNPDLRIDEHQHYQLSEAVKRLLAGEPVQYVTGIARFNDLLLKVSPAVLIPRPETEELVQKIGTSSPKEPSIRIWDIGTGSGCIAIALAKQFPHAEVVAFDVSEETLQIARENAESNGAKVTFVPDDILHPTSDYFSHLVDLVVSNPPYVCDNERALMEDNVLNWEPEKALFVPDDDPLRFYRQILALAKTQLNPDGQVWFEINERMGEKMLSLCQEMGFSDSEIILDYADKPRFCRARLVP
jgi:release factor glutamine methyltransferase